MQTMDKISTPAIDKNRLKSKWVEKGYLQSDIAREYRFIFIPLMQVCPSSVDGSGLENRHTAFDETVCLRVLLFCKELKLETLPLSSCSCLRVLLFCK